MGFPKENHLSWNVKDNLNVMTVHKLGAISVQLIQNTLLRIQTFYNWCGGKRRLGRVEHQFEVGITDHLQKVFHSGSFFEAVTGFILLKFILLNENQNMYKKCDHAKKFLYFKKR